MERYRPVRIDHNERWRTRPRRRRGGNPVTAPYSYDGMLPLGPEQGSEYVCSTCESTFDDEHYLCPVCGTLTLERRSVTER